MQFECIISFKDLVVDFFPIRIFWLKKKIFFWNLTREYNDYA